MKENLRIAHLILAHKNPEQVLHLVQSLMCPEMDCYIHVDAKVDLTEFVSLLGGLPQVFFIQKRADIQWAGYGTIQATLNGFSEILSGDIYYDYLHVMSGQDYPIKSIPDILHYIKTHYGKEFFDLIHDRWPVDIATRYTKYHFVNCKVPGKYRLGMLVSSLLPARKFFFDGPVLGSSNWFMVTRNCASYLLDRINGDKSLTRYFKHVWGPDEFVFINLLNNSPFRDKIEGRGIHYMEWGNENAHARTLTVRDLNHLVESDKLFARKFDDRVDPEIIMKLNRFNGFNYQGQD